ncbi:MAG: ATP-binding cassette domain-containing protein [Gemmatimonadales bacterium]|nr:ATP-binding cassette domain-containing protein [Gemmatimonadales bacterium]
MSPPATPPPALELLGIVRSFGPVHALRGADFVLRAGEVHALLGENGAGKSTLMRIAYGLEQADSGTIRVNGAERTIRSPGDARRQGIGMVHQHFTSIPALSVAENVALAAGWPISPRTLSARVRRLSESAGLPLDPDTPAGSLPAGLKQRLEIVKALAADARILLLDEPTAALAPAEAEDLLRVARRFSGGDGAVVLITHKLQEALGTADRITVLRAGRVVASGPAVAQDAGSLAAAMIGNSGDARAEGAGTRHLDQPKGDVLVRCESLEVARQGREGIAVAGVTLEVRSGEAVGVAAIEGNGQRELLRAVAGRLRPSGGRLEVAAPVGFIPEDRTTEGLIAEFTLTENVVLGSGDEAPWIRGGRIDWRSARAATATLIRDYAISASSPDVPAASLSGGSQQKLIVARELSRGPRVIVAENPTRGLDIHAARAVMDRFRGAAGGGAAVLFHSSDLDELIAWADRIVVMATGRLLELPGDATRTAVGQAMLSQGR